MLLLFGSLMVLAHGYSSISTTLRSHRRSKGILSTTSLDISKKGPGETNKEPLSTATASRIELAKMIVSAAILYMTIQLNLEKAVAKWMPDGLGVDNIINAADGVKFEDIYLGEGELIREGNIFTADCKLFYNGLPVDMPTGNSYSVTLNDGGDGKSSDSNIIIASYSTQDKDQEDLTGLMKGMKGLRVGGRRKIVVPPALAFGDRGLPPYIPPNANVLYDVKLISITNDESKSTS